MEAWKFEPGKLPVKLDNDPDPNKDLGPLYKLIDCSTVELVTLPFGQAWFDEEGFFKPSPKVNTYIRNVVAVALKANVRDVQQFVGVAVLRIKKGYALCGNAKDGFYVARSAKDGTHPPLDLSEPTARKGATDFEKMGGGF